MSMKEQKISISMKDSTNYPNSQTAAHVLKSPRQSPMDLLFEIGFVIASAVYLLLIGLSCFVMSYSITNRTVCNNISILLGCFGSL